MSPKILKAIIALKAVVLLGLIGFIGREYIMERLSKLPLGLGKSVAVAEKPVESKVKQSGDIVIPKGDITVTEGNDIRSQLEFLKQDVDNRLAAIVEARKGYEAAKATVEEKLKKIEEERKMLDETLQKEKKVKEERLAEIIEFVSKMEPKKAAPVLEGMDRDLVIALMKKLPARFVTKALESMTSKKAVEYMEYYTRIRSGREFELMKELGLCKPDNAVDAAATPSPVGAAPTPAPTVVPTAAATPAAG